MSARTPDEVHPLFARHFAAAHMAGLLSLYPPDAVLLSQPGLVARGHAAIGYVAIDSPFGAAGA